MLLQLRLSRLDPSIFAVPRYSLLPSKSLKISKPMQDFYGPQTNRRSTVPEIPSSISPLTPDTAVSGTDSPPPPAAINRRTFPFELGSPEALQEEAMLKMESASPDSALIQQRAKEAWHAYLGLAEDAKTSIDRSERLEKRTPQPGDQLIVTTTGTGSATPSKYRNG